VAHSGGSGGQPARARVSVLWVPPRLSVNWLDGAEGGGTRTPAGAVDGNIGGFFGGGGGGGRSVWEWERSDHDVLVLPAEPAVVDAQWHPAQPDCVVALTAAGQLGVYRLQRGGAELRFALTAMFAPRTIPVPQGGDGGGGIRGRRGRLPRVDAGARPTEGESLTGACEESWRIAR
jgi:hypothetical protein